MLCKIKNRVYNRTKRLAEAKAIIIVWSAMLRSDCVDGSLQFGVTPGGGGKTPQCPLAADGIFPGILAKEQKLRRFYKSYGAAMASYSGLLTDINCL
jgi:hypothetical protein